MSNDAPGRCGIFPNQPVTADKVFGSGQHREVFQKLHILFGDKVGNEMAFAGAAEADEIGNPVDQNSRFAAACTGKKKQGSVRPP